MKLSVSPTLGERLHHIVDLWASPGLTESIVGEKGEDGHPGNWGPSGRAQWGLIRTPCWGAARLVSGGAHEATTHRPPKGYADMMLE
jgi:hypothetical protein